MLCFYFPFIGGFIKSSCWSSSAWIQARSPWKTWFQIFGPIVPTQLWNIPGIPSWDFSAFLSPPGATWAAFVGPCVLLLVSFPARYSPTVRLWPWWPPVPRHHGTWMVNGQEAHPWVFQRPSAGPAYYRHSLCYRHSCIKRFVSKGKRTLLWVKNLRFWSQLHHFPSLGLVFLMCNVIKLGNVTSGSASSFDLLWFWWRLWELSTGIYCGHPESGAGRWCLPHNLDA